jgi:hypothetical protein
MGAEMHLGFRTATLPPDVTPRFVAAHTEGELRVTVGSRMFVRFQALLLVELALAVRLWLHALDSGEAGDFSGSRRKPAVAQTDLSAQPRACGVGPR